MIIFVCKLSLESSHTFHWEALSIIISQSWSGGVTSKAKYCGNGHPKGQGTLIGCNVHLCVSVSFYKCVYLCLCVCLWLWRQSIVGHPKAQGHLKPLEGRVLNPHLMISPLITEIQNPTITKIRSALLSIGHCPTKILVIQKKELLPHCETFSWGMIWKKWNNFTDTMMKITVKNDDDEDDNDDDEDDDDGEKWWWLWWNDIILIMRGVGSWSRPWPFLTNTALCFNLYLTGFILVIMLYINQHCALICSCAFHLRCVCDGRVTPQMTALFFCLFLTHRWLL